MEKMVSPKGVKANLCCASCEYSTTKVVPAGPGVRGIKVEKWCSKKNTNILSLGSICDYYAMGKFFRERGYKIIKE